jgi:brefeldin A-resistance guanine nucleotide exchange factor 1
LKKLFLYIFVQSLLACVCPYSSIDTTYDLQDDQLISGFNALRTELSYAATIADVSADNILQPFLAVVTAQTTSGMITNIALVAVAKFISHGIINRESMGLQPAITALAAAITHCRFEVTDHAEDDAILLRLLELMEEVVCGLGADSLDDEAVCEVIETCLSMACQTRRSDLLRQSAEMTMIKLTWTVFARLPTVAAEEADSATSINGIVSEGGNDIVLQMSGPKNVKVSEEFVHVTDESLAASIVLTNGKLPETNGIALTANSGPKVADSTLPIGPKKAFEPYGICSLREYFRVLISIVDASNYHIYTDSTRIMALQLINIIFETAGRDIASHKSLLALTNNNLLKHLLQLIRTENLVLLQKALTVTVTIFVTMQEHLKLQQEVFITYLLTCLSPIAEISREEGVSNIFYDGVPSIPKAVLAALPKVPIPTNGLKSRKIKSSPSIADLTAADSNTAPIPKFVTARSPDSREMFVEALTTLARQPSFFADLYLNYDCDPDRSDLFEDLVGFFCRNAYPDSKTWSTHTVPLMCLEAVLGYLEFTMSRLSRKDQDGTKLARIARKLRARKKLVIEASEKFNKAPLEGLEFLVENKLITADTIEGKVEFLHSSGGRLDKKLLGEFLAKPSNKVYLDHFIESFDFSNTSIDEALRDLFTSFRLPGESQQIERIIEKFAEQYIAGSGNVKEVFDKDAAFVLSYAVIMLNTDLHNPQNKRQMTIEEFRRNLRAVNNGEDFDQKYLNKIYSSIKKREIIMPEEHNNEESFEHIWKVMITKSQKKLTQNFMKCESNAYDKDMFELTWKPVVTMLAYIFATASEDAVFARVITGIDQAAVLALQYDTPGVHDHIVAALCKISTLSFGDFAVPKSTVQVQIEKEKLAVSDLSIQFGSDYKAQLAAMVMYRVALDGTRLHRLAWEEVLAALTNLYLYAMIDMEFSKSQQKLCLPPLPVVAPTHVIQRSKSNKEVVGLFSTLSSYLTGYHDSAAQEPTEDEIDATLSAVDCLRMCKIKDFLRKMLELPEASKLEILDVIESKLKTLIGEKKPEEREDFYEAALFLLEIGTLFSIETVSEKITRRMVDLFRECLKVWGEVNEFFLSRVLVYYVVTLRHSSDAFAADLAEALAIISSIDHEVLSYKMPQLVVPLVALADEGAWSCTHVVSNSHFWGLLVVAVGQSESTAIVFTFIEEIVRVDTEVSAENVFEVVKVLGELASIGSLGAQLEQDKVAIYNKFKAKFDAPIARAKADEVVHTIETTIARSVRAVEMIQALESHAALGSDIWYAFVYQFSQQSINPCRAIRDRAFEYYTQLLNMGVVGKLAWEPLLIKGVCPLIDALGQEDVLKTDPEGMPKTQAALAQLLVRLLTGRKDSIKEEIWSKVQAFLDTAGVQFEKDEMKELAQAENKDKETET